MSDLYIMYFNNVIKYVFSKYDLHGIGKITIRKLCGNNSRETIREKYMGKQPPHSSLPIVYFPV